MSDYPKTCPTCGHRRDRPESAYYDWEYARGMRGLSEAEQVEAMVRLSAARNADTPKKVRDLLAPGDKR